MKPSHMQKSLMILVVGLLLMMFGSQVLAYEDYSGCSDCHGDFRNSPYIAKDGTNWGTDLMSEHESFVGGECDACHQSKKLIRCF